MPSRLVFNLVNYYFLVFCGLFNCRAHFLIGGHWFVNEKLQRKNQRELTHACVKTKSHFFTLALIN